MVVCFVDASTMVFGSTDAVTKALDARDGTSPSLLTNQSMMEAMKTVDSDDLWSILDEKGNSDHDAPGARRSWLSSPISETVRKRLQASWYGMDFQHGVKFNLTISTGDTFRRRDHLFTSDGCRRLAQNQRFRMRKSRL